MSQQQVYDKFENLAQTHFVQRCAMVEVSENTESKVRTPVPAMTITEQQLYLVEPMDTDRKYI